MFLSFKPLASLSLCTLLFASGCSTSSEVEVVDLNKVLDIFEQTLIELDGADASDVDVTAIASSANGDVVSGDAPVGADPALTSDPAKGQEFLAAYRANLNEAKLVSKPVGVLFDETGTIVGFSDPNDNTTQDAGESKLFTIQIDAERGRLIASDMSNNHRDHSYRPSGGFFMGYMMASMMGRQGSYYSGARSGLKPDLGKTQISPKNYHSSAVSKARASSMSSGSRTRTGSKGFSFGK